MKTRYKIERIVRMVAIVEARDEDEAEHLAKSLDTSEFDTTSESYNVYEECSDD